MTDYMDSTGVQIQEIRELLEQIREDKELSYGEIIFLHEHQDIIKEHFPDDVELWQWADIPETEWSNQNKGAK